MDKHELEHFIRQIEKYTWNYYTQKPCLKIQLINNSGGETLKGELVKLDTANDNYAILTGADDHECIGAWAEDGEQDGELAWIIIGGSAQYRLKDTTVAVHGNWIKTSDTAGRADASNAAPPGGGVVQIDEHLQEIGHCSESAGAGTDVLVEGIMHFN
jgi:hypothetical protein